MPDSKVISSVAERWDERRARTQGSVTAEDLVLRSIKGGKNIDEAAALVAQYHKLAKPLALEFVVLVVAKAYYTLPHRCFKGDLKEKLKRIRERFVSLVKNSKYNKEILVAARGFIGLGRRCSPDIFHELIVDAPEPMSLGIELANATYCSTLLAQLNQIEPGNRALAWMLATGRRYLFVRPSRRLALLTNLSMRMQAPSADDPLFEHSVAVQRKLLYNLLNAGLAAQAIRVYENLPSALKKALLEKEPRRVEKELDGLPFVIEPISRTYFTPKAVSKIILLELAAAHESLGQRAKAKKLFNELPWNGAKIAEEMTNGERPRPPPPPILKWILLDRLLRNATNDPYPWVRQAFGQRISGELGASRIWVGLIVRSLGEEAYSSIRHSLESQWGRHWMEYVESIQEEAGSFVSFGKEFQKRTDYFQLKLEQSFQSLVEKDVSIVSSVIRSYSHRICFLPPSPWQPFPERQLPKHQQTKRDWRPGTYVQPKLPERVAQLPGGERLLRFEASGSRAVALSTKSREDLDGVTSGIQVHLSSDGGRTWNESISLYLGDGLRYSIRPDSKRRLLTEDYLEPEAYRYSCVQIPLVIVPLGIRYCFNPSDVYLRISLAALRADTDHDGMTDIFEKRLMLDPNNPDTDGDGLKDGDDPTPNVPLTSEADLDIEWRIAVLNEIFSRVRRSPVTIKLVPRKTRAKVLKKTQKWKFKRDLPTIVLEGKKEEWGALLPDRRVIVMSKDEVQQHLETVGGDPATMRIRPIHFHLVVFNRDRTKGFITWSWGCCLGARGGTVEVTKTKTGWTAESISSWMS